MSDDRTWLRHAVATIAYRGGKVLRDAPETVSFLRICPTSRSTVEIIAHINDLLEWAHSIVTGDERWTTPSPKSWHEENERFYIALQSLDEALSTVESLNGSAMRLFHGPLADALTHIGQIATLRRFGGSPVKGENYFKASIAAGQIGPDQPPPAYEFN